MTPVHLRSQWWAIPVPDDAQDFDFEIDTGEDWYRLTYCTKIDDEDSGFYGEWEQQSVQIPEGSWQILCTLKVCTPMQALLIVERFAVNLPTYKNYEWPKGSDFFWKPMDSLHSLIKSKGLDTETNILIMQNNSNADTTS